MKVAELEGPKLAEWAARAQLWHVEPEDGKPGGDLVVHPPDGVPRSFGEFGYRPDLNWSQGGPVVDRLIESGYWQIEPWEGREWPRANTVNARNYAGVVDSGVESLGNNTMPRADFPAPTVLVAACRALVFSVYGAEVPDA